MLLRRKAFQYRDESAILWFAMNYFRLSFLKKCAVINCFRVHCFHPPRSYSAWVGKCSTKIVCQRYSILTIRRYVSPFMLKTVYGPTGSAGGYTLRTSARFFHSACLATLCHS